MSNNEQIKLIEENAKWVKGKIDETMVSLNYKKFKANLALNEEEAKRFDALTKYTTNLSFDSTSFEKSLFNNDTTDLKEKRKRWHESLSQDIYVEEAINVLQDLKMAYPLKKVAAAVKN